MVKLWHIERGSYCSSLQISTSIQGSACNLCRAQLSGAITMAMCGHIFHDRCIRKWKSDVCPCCQELLDEPSLEALDVKERPVLPKGTLVMIQGIKKIQRSLNGTYAQIVDYSDVMDSYMVRQKA